MLLGQVAERVDHPVRELGAGDREPEHGAADLEWKSGRAPAVVHRHAVSDLRPTRHHLGCRPALHGVGGQTRDRRGRPVPEPDGPTVVDEEHALAEVREDTRRLVALAAQQPPLGEDGRQEVHEQEQAAERDEAADQDAIAQTRARAWTRDEGMSASRAIGRSASRRRVEATWYFVPPSVSVCGRSR